MPEAGFQLGFGDVAAAVVALDLLQGLGEPGGAEDLPQRDVGGAGPLVGGSVGEQAERGRVGRGGGPEAAYSGVSLVELRDQAVAERLLPARACRGRLPWLSASRASSRYSPRVAMPSLKKVRL